jgi:Flp pilus assembly pilin Flp
MAESTRKRKDRPPRERTMKARIAALRARFNDRIDESGQGLAEYALILTLVVLGVVAALGILGSTIAGSDGFRIFDFIP